MNLETGKHAQLWAIRYIKKGKVGYRAFELPVDRWGRYKFFPDMLGLVEATSEGDALYVWDQSRREDLI